MSDYYSEQESKALEFAKLSGLPFVYQYTGGGFSAIYGVTSSHLIYITDENGSLPDVDDVHYVGVYLIADDSELVGEIFPRHRADLLATISRLDIGSLDDLVDFVLESGRFTAELEGEG